MRRAAYVCIVLAAIAAVGILVTQRKPVFRGEVKTAAAPATAATPASTDLEVSPQLQDDGETRRESEVSSTEQSQPEKDLIQCRQELAEKNEEIARLAAALDKARNQPLEDLRERFEASDLARGLTDDDRRLLFGRIVVPLRRLPPPEKLEPLLRALHRDRAARDDWDWRWALDPAGPQSRSDDPRTPDLMNELEALEELWRAEIETIFEDDPDAVAVLTDD